MQLAWAAFARDPENGLKKLEWPEYDVQQKSLVVLGKKGSTAAGFEKGDAYDNGCLPGVG